MGNGYQNTSLFTGVCLPECIYLVYKPDCQLSSLLKPGDAAQSCGPVLQMVALATVFGV